MKPPQQEPFLPQAKDQHSILELGGGLALITILLAGGIFLGWHAHRKDRHHQTLQFDSLLTVHLDARDLARSESLLLAAGDVIERDARQNALAEVERLRQETREDKNRTRGIDTARWRRLMFHWQERMLDAVLPLPRAQQRQVLREVAACRAWLPDFLPCEETNLMLAVDQRDWPEVAQVAHRILALDSSNLWARGGFGIVYLVGGDPPSAREWIPHLRTKPLDGSGIQAYYGQTDRSSRLLTYWEPLRAAALATRGLALCKITRPPTPSRGTDWRTQAALDSNFAMLSLVAEGWRRLGVQESIARYQSLIEHTKGRFVAYGIGELPLRQRMTWVELPDPQGRHCQPLPGHADRLDVCYRNWAPSPPASDNIPR
jgi:hypothetical protein